MRLSIPILLLLAGAALAEDDLAEVTARLAAALDTGSVPDAQQALTALPPLYAKGTEEQQKTAVETVGKAAKADDLTVRHGAFAALGAMRAKGSSKYLGKWLNPPKKFKGEIPLSHLEAIRAAGQIADATTLATLEDLSDHADLPIAEAATQALGGYKDLPTKRRKALALDLVSRLEQLAAVPRRKWSEEQAARKATLAAATMAALRGLTGQEYQTVEGWKKWKENAESQANPFDS
jgi:hypothetical protein